LAKEAKAQAVREMEKFKAMKVGEQRAESREQRAESREQRAESREQRAESREESRAQRASCSI
jgi:hypothetical protein